MWEERSLASQRCLGVATARGTQTARRQHDARTRVQLRDREPVPKLSVQAHLALAALALEVKGITLRCEGGKMWDLPLRRLDWAVVPGIVPR